MEEFTRRLLKAKGNGTPDTVVVDLNRAKTVITALVSIAAVLLGVSNAITAMMSAPRQLEDMRREVAALHSTDTEADKRLALLEQNISFIRETLQDIRSDMQAGGKHR